MSPNQALPSTADNCSLLNFLEHAQHSNPHKCKWCTISNWNNGATLIPATQSVRHRNPLVRVTKRETYRRKGKAKSKKTEKSKGVYCAQHLRTKPVISYNNNQPLIWHLSTFFATPCQTTKQSSTCNSKTHSSFLIFSVSAVVPAHGLWFVGQSEMYPVTGAPDLPPGVSIRPVDEIALDPTGATHSNSALYRAYLVLTNGSCEFLSWSFLEYMIIYNNKISIRISVVYIYI